MSLNPDENFKIENDFEIGFFRIPDFVLEDMKEKMSLLVYMALLYHSNNQTGSWFPSIRKLAKFLMFSTATVLKGIHVLKKMVL